MHIARTPGELAAALAILPRPLGLVPTMGALHAGHHALAAAARARCASVACSIFVNPSQFAPGEDFATYPRDEGGDLAQLREAGCDLAWLPAVADLYPPGHATVIVPGGPAEHWEGANRPGHFSGVATICTKLFNHVRPDLAFFGEKDWQQLQVVTRLVADLALPLAIVPVPTVRDADGLALSSRNSLLSADQRAAAPALAAALRSAAAAGATQAALATARGRLAASGFIVDYLALVDGPSLAVITHPAPGARLIAAAHLGRTRLLDNVPT